MNAFTIILVAVALAALVIKLSSLFGMKVNNPNKVPLSSSMGIIEKKYKDISGAAINAYPAIVLRDEDGTSRKLRLTSWAVYEDLYEGDRIQINHRDWQAREVFVLQRGENYAAAQIVRSTPARFRRSYVSNTTLYRHSIWAEFITDNGETLTLRPPTGWKSPAKNARGTLSWHGDTLDYWKEET